MPNPGGGAQDRAYAVSYNRPFITRGIDGQQGGPAAGAHDYLFGADYAAIYWLEQNGFDVSYMSGVDTDRLGAEYLEKYQSFISMGHDEYWSADQRYNVEAARDAGVNLLFWGGNDIYWKTRWDVSIVDGVEYRTLVCYKETWANGDPNAGPNDYYNLDPSDIWTGTWRDERFLGNPLAGNENDRPPLTGQPDFCHCSENQLTGTLFGPDGAGQFGGALDVPADYSVLRVWRDTSVANGGAIDMADGILGYEWNTSPDNEYRPAGLIKLSETTIPWNAILVDQGNVTAPGTATHNLTLYRASSGALVFSAGTVFWSWGLSNEHDSSPYGADIANPDLQQFVLNLFADMGIQPGVSDAVLASQGIVRATASTDTVAASATMVDLPDTVSALSTVTISGTATDNDGNPLTSDGVVAIVEVSLNGGQTWHVASGTAQWTYAWTPMQAGTYTIVARAIDDSLNLAATIGLDTEVVQVGPPVVPELVSLFSFTTVTGTMATETSPLELGTRFYAREAGVVTELKYYRHAEDSTDTDVRVGHLWDANGNLLATVQFTSAPGQVGWQTATLSAPIILQAGAEYVVSYNTADNYVASSAFFNTPFLEPYGMLGTPGLNNGVFSYGSGLTFPTSSYANSNYWVDVSFQWGSINNEGPVFTSSATVSVAENTNAVTTLTATDPEGNPITFSITGGPDAALFTLNVQTGALSFISPLPNYEAPADAGGDNVYNLIVSASDGLNDPVTQTLSVSVTNVENEPPAPVTSHLFGPSNLPAGVTTNDPVDYELGTRFQADRNGMITELRYYRGAPDAGDTDTRTLHLWDANGILLGSTTVAAAPGATGWQVGALAAPIAISAGATYTVSYGTVQNYAYTSNFFTTQWDGPDGILNGAAVSGNGVFSAGSTGLFPTSTYGNSNYWVDVTFQSGSIVNNAPVFTSAATASVAENTNAVTTLTATDPEGNPLTFSIAGGDDAALFTLNAQTGALSFVSPLPNYEAPADAGGDNVYNLIVSVSDGSMRPVTQTLSVSVTNVENEPPAPVTSHLFGPSNLPAGVVTDDPADYELGTRFQADRNGMITELRYYRGAPDAGDTDTRTLHLWDANGILLGSTTVAAAPGATGWQVGALAAPIAISAGATYTVSYGTVQNYAATSNFFTTQWDGPDGILNGAAVSGNGVFSAGSTGLFPTSTYGNSNYWVDVTFQSEPIVNDAPVFTSAATASVAENTNAVTTLTATDPEGNPLTFSIAGGDDAALFTLNAQTGALSFVSPLPNYEAPADTDGDNVYSLIVSVSDGVNAAVTQTLSVSVTNVENEPAAP